jgi:hypothetical protein
MKKKLVPHNKKNKDAGPAPLPKGATVEDPDDLVHSKKQERPTETGEQDPDDLVHGTNQPRPEIKKNDNLEDPDDLVHGF